MSTLCLNKNVKQSFDFPYYSYDSFDDLISKLVHKLMEYNTKIIIDNIEYLDERDENDLNIKAKYFGFIKDEKILGYVCIVPPSCARNGFITQQLMPGLLPIYLKEKASIRIFSRPVYIFDFLKKPHQPSQLVTITNFRTIGCHYFDMILGRNVDDEFIEKEVKKSFDNLEDLNEYLISRSRSNPKCNDFYRLDIENHVVFLLKNHFKSKNYDYFISLTNEPYFYCGRLFLIIQYALLYGWKININDFDEYEKGSNVNIDCILKFIDAAIKDDF